jgi:hypothetical protein
MLRRRYAAHALLIEEEVRKTTARMTFYHAENGREQQFGHIAEPSWLGACE